MSLNVLAVDYDHGALCHAHGGPLDTALIKQSAEDFRVSEQLDFNPDGEGEHLWLRLRKRELNTLDLIAQLASELGVPANRFGYSGLKDRNAVTEQWLSLPWPIRRPLPELPADADGYELLDRVRHSRRLRHGTHKRNRFALILRGIDVPPERVEARWQRMISLGVPNYFGAQRFGNAGRNLMAAARMFSGTMTVKSKRKAGLFLSAARAMVFNEVLSQRVAAQSWDRACPGERLMLAGSRSFFLYAQQPDTEARLAAMDIHPSGPLVGFASGEEPGLPPVEQAVFAARATWLQAIAATGVSADRRALRVVLQDPGLKWLDAHTVQLRFALPAGAYATAAVRELFAAGE